MTQYGLSSGRWPPGLDILAVAHGRFNCCIHITCMIHNLEHMVIIEAHLFT